MDLLTKPWAEPVSSGTRGKASAGCAQNYRPADETDGHLEKHLHAASPIFLHSSWRTSHTWFWLKFREHSSTICFYEPFHESLSTVTRSEALSLRPNSWDSRHPESEPYFLEYLPLIRRAGGVRLFAPETSYRWFFPLGGPLGGLRPEEIKYLALLLRHANRRQRLPVFGFTRSLGRMAAIKKQFSGIHIFQYRNLWTQWMSWVGHKANNNDYFCQRFLEIMIETEDTYLSSIISRYLPRCDKPTTAQHSRKLSSDLLKSLDDQDLFTLYMAFHIYLYMCSHKHADLIIDITKLERDKDYRDQVRSSLLSVTGLPIALDDVSENQRYYSLDPASIDWMEIKKNFEFAVLMLDHVIERQELVRYGTRLLNETLAEIEVSERYVAAARDQITKVTGERDLAVAGSTALAVENNQLAAERDALLAERDRLSAQHRKAAAELDRLTRELAAGNGYRENLISENAHLTSEVAKAVETATQHASDLAALRLEHTALRTELSLVEADRAQTAMQSERWFNAAVVWPSDAGMHPHRLQLAQWLRRLKAWLSGWLRGGRIVCPPPWDQTRTRANDARDARQWELAARFYADELNRNLGDAAIWVQFGHALKTAGQLSEAEIAYREALALDVSKIDALLSLGYLLSVQDRQAEAEEIYTRVLDLEIPLPLRCAIAEELKVLTLRTEAILDMGRQT